ncbi:hypothetical protein [Trinickia sp.]|uniref:hypothetical protein n=1 Tax=Trinickia sp. TaxID=2571163 RepID=UPI003F808925
MAVSEIEKKPEQSSRRKTAPICAHKGSCSTRYADAAMKGDGKNIAERFNRSGAGKNAAGQARGFSMSEVQSAAWAFGLSLV